MKWYLAVRIRPYRYNSPGCNRWWLGNIFFFNILILFVCNQWERSLRPRKLIRCGTSIFPRPRDNFFPQTIRKYPPRTRGKPRGEWQLRTVRTQARSTDPGLKRFERARKQPTLACTCSLSRGLSVLLVDAVLRLELSEESRTPFTEILG